MTQRPASFTLRCFLGVCLTFGGSMVGSTGATAAVGPEPLTVGIDFMADAGLGWRREGRVGSSLNGMALICARWAPVQATGAHSTWRGEASLLGLFGRGPSSRYLHDLLGADNLEGPEGLRLYTWWIEHSQGPWTVQAGAMLADDSFALTEPGAHLVNGSFGWLASISANALNAGPAYPVATLGLRIGWRSDGTLGWQLGIFDGDNLDSPEGDSRGNRHGWHYALNGRQGCFLITELEWRPTEEATSTIKFGTWVHTASTPDAYRDEAGRPYPVTGAEARLHDGNYGFYALAERWLLGRADLPGSLKGHLRYGLAPPDRNTLSWAADMGLAWNGPLPSRPQDILAVGYSIGGFSRDYRIHQQLVNPTLSSPDHEQVAEVSYLWIIGTNACIQPDIQWITGTLGNPQGGTTTLLTIRFIFKH